MKRRYKIGIITGLLLWAGCIAYAGSKELACACCDSGDAPGSGRW